MFLQTLGYFGFSTGQKEPFEACVASLLSFGLPCFSVLYYCCVIIMCLALFLWFFLIELTVKL